MKKFFCLLNLSIVLLSQAKLAAWELNKLYPVKLLRCIDGDTADFIGPEGKERVRFLFVDTPESTAKIEPGGPEAAAFTCSRLKAAKEILLETDGPSLRGRYGRLLAWIWVDKNLLQVELAKKGMVKRYYDYGDYKYEDLVRKADTHQNN